MDFESLTYSVSEIDDKYVTEAVEYFNRRKPARILKKLQVELSFWGMMFVFGLTILFLMAALGYAWPYYLVNSVFTDAIMYMTPEKETCEDNGIIFTVESVSTEKAQATMYISIQDTQGNRVNAATQLEGYCGIFTIRDELVSCVMSEYDAVQNKATYQILIRHRNGKNIEGRKLILRMYQFMDGDEPVQGKWKVAVQV